MMIGLVVNGKPHELELDFGDLSTEDTLWALKGIIYGRLRGTSSGGAVNPVGPPGFQLDDLDVDLGTFAEALLADVQRAANGLG